MQILRHFWPFWRIWQRGSSSLRVFHFFAERTPMRLLGALVPAVLPCPESPHPPPPSAGSMLSIPRETLPKVTLSRETPALNSGFGVCFVVFFFNLNKLGSGGKVPWKPEWSKTKKGGTFLVVQWLKNCASPAGGRSSIPAQGTKILHVT